MNDDDKSALLQITYLKLRSGYQILRWYNDVELVPQGSSNTCWLAALRMVVRYRSRNRYVLREGAVELDKELYVAAQERTNSARSLYHSQSDLLRRGFQVVHTRPSADALFPQQEFESILTRIIEKTGPFVLGGFMRRIGHYVLVFGVDNGRIGYHDPAPVSHGERVSSLLFGTFCERFHGDTDGTMEIVHLGKPLDWA